MKTAYISHTDCLLHNMGDFHPESPQRLHAIEDRLVAAHLMSLLRHYDAPAVTREQLLRVHAADYVDGLAARAPEPGAKPVMLDPDTWLAAQTLPAAQRAALERAAERLKAYATHQKMESWSYTEADGTLLGQQVTPLDRVGLYVPGGKAAYPSSVLMNAIPAKVAGVQELIMVVPTPDGVVNELVFAAAAVVGVDRVFAIGGAQAVAALAYGTESVPGVDKVVGPGNL